jgi:hypothetical protein
VRLVAGPENVALPTKNLHSQNSFAQDLCSHIYRHMSGLSSWNHSCLFIIQKDKEVIMTSARRTADLLLWILLVITVLVFAPPVHAGNEVMGALQFEGKSKVEQSSGVWVDGGYVGYLKELKGSKKVLLLPGEHVITVRQDGYQDFTQRVAVQPGQKQVIRVAMEKAPTGAIPAVTATVKINVNPNRAAVFMDGLYVGHVGEFDGIGQGMLVAPGVHKIKVALPGYRTFETQINPSPNQKVEVKTDLVKDNAPVSDPLLKPGNESVPTPPPSGPDATSPQR